MVMSVIDAGRVMQVQNSKYNAKALLVLATSDNTEKTLNQVIFVISSTILKHNSSWLERGCGLVLSSDLFRDLFVQTVKKYSNADVDIIVFNQVSIQGELYILSIPCTIWYLHLNFGLGFKSNSSLVRECTCRSGRGSCPTFVQAYGFYNFKNSRAFRLCYHRIMVFKIWQWTTFGHRRSILVKFGQSYQS